MLLDGRINKIPVKFMGRGSSVSIAPRYGLGVRGSNPGGGEIFRIRPDRPWGPPSLLYNGYRVFPEVKRTGRCVDHPPPSSADIKERVELYPYSPFGPLWPVLGWTLPLTLPVKFAWNCRDIFMMLDNVWKKCINLKLCHNCKMLLSRCLVSVEEWWPGRRFQNFP